MSKKIRAGQVGLDRDLKITQKVGEVQAFDSGKQYATISRLKQDGSEKSAMEVLEEIFMKDNLPTATAPKATLSNYGTVNAEAGSTMGLTVKVNYTDGKYTLGGVDTAAGCVAGQVTVNAMQNGSVIDTVSGAVNTLLTFTGEGKSGVLRENGPVTLEYSLQYAAASVTPLSALDNEQPQLKIAAGSLKNTGAGVTVRTPLRKRFYGIFTGSAPADSAAIRALAGSNLTLAKGQSVTLTANASTKGMCIAVPHSLGITSIEALLTSSLNADISGEFNKTSVNVYGDNNYNAVAYDVYTFMPAAMTGDEVVKITLK